MKYSRRILSSTFLLLLGLSGCSERKELIKPLYGEWHVSESFNGLAGKAQNFSKGEIVWTIYRSKIRIENRTNSSIQKKAYNIRNRDGESYLFFKNKGIPTGYLIKAEENKMSINYSSILIKAKGGGFTKTYQTYGGATVFRR